VSYKSINLAQKFGLFAEHWSPKVVAEMNDGASGRRDPAATVAQRSGAESRAVK
jgi:hypothetical protein